MCTIEIKYMQNLGGFSATYNWELRARLVPLATTNSGGPSHTPFILLYSTCKNEHNKYYIIREKNGYLHSINNSKKP